jgi:K+/H+ antiporter YhaU regulatory subunit KhtT
MRIKNWDKYNHYKHKSDMKWFKCYGRDLLNDADFMMMDDIKQVTLFKLWCLASEAQGNLPQVSEIAFRLRKPIDFVEKMLKELDSWLITGESLDKFYNESITDKIREDKIIKHSVRFNEFWEKYPTTRKVNKKTCLEKWKAKDLDLIADKVIAYVEKMKESKQWIEGFSPSPLTLLNQERWEDNNIPQIRKAWEGGI